jgi:Ni/Co efflux regulator RcnB
MAVNRPAAQPKTLAVPGSHGHSLEPHMKKSAAIINIILAVSLSTTGFAFAQERRDGNERSRGEAGQRDGTPDRRGPPQWHQPQAGERGAGPKHNFRQGDRLPRAQHQKRYVVNDWRARQLSEPPRGYHWVQTGGDYVLVAIATGVILQLLLSN